MKTKTSMNKLRALIAAGSFAGFVGGWALLAQSGAPTKAQLPAAVITSAGTVHSQAPGLLRTATAQPAATAVATPAGAAKATSTRAPAATAVKAATAMPKLKTGGSR